MRLLSQLLLIPAALGLMAPIAVEAGGENRKDQHDHSNHMMAGDSYPSTMFMGKTTFVLGGVDGVSDSGMSAMSGMSGMGGMSSSEEKDGTVFHTIQS